MADIPVSAISINVGLSLSEVFQAIDENGDSFANDGRTVIAFSASNDDDITATIATPAKAQGLALQNFTTLITSDEVLIYGPFDPALFNDSTGNVQITYSAAGVNTLVAAFKIGA